MAVNEAGIAAVAVFYLVILAVGIAAAWRQKKRNQQQDDQPQEQQQEIIMLAKRDLGLFVGILTMTGQFI